MAEVITSSSALTDSRGVDVRNYKRLSVCGCDCPDFGLAACARDALAFREAADTRGGARLGHSRPQRLHRKHASFLYTELVAASCSVMHEPCALARRNMIRNMTLQRHASHCERAQTE